MRVNRHFMRLSQEVLGTDVNIDISQGTCTMKYSPKFQEHIAARHPGITEVHPLQDPDTIQGILEMYYKFEGFLKELSGMDYFSLQPGGGAHGVFTNASIIRAYTSLAATTNATRSLPPCFHIPATPRRPRRQATRSLHSCRTRTAIRIWRR